MIKPHATYKIKCHGCRYARDFGAARLTAELEADRHAKRYVHAIEVIESVRMYLIEPKKVQQQLGDDPPF